MFDTVTGAMDTASQMLAGGANTPGGPTADSDATFLRGIDLDADTKKIADPNAPNLVNVYGQYPVIEFIHFGYVHTSHSNLFVHEDYSDKEKNDKVKEGDKPRGIQFRSALEREAILLATFMECTQTVLDEREKSSAMGGLGGALNTLGNMAGMGGGGSGKMKPADLNSHINKVVDATKPILPDLIEYKNTHKAGIDYHQARANYRALLQKLIDEKPEADPASSLMGKLPGVGGVAGTFGKIISFTQGVAFKAQDVKAKFYAYVAQQSEPQIELACNEMSLKAIQGLFNPFLPVWFGEGKKGEQAQFADTAAANPIQKGSYGNIGNVVADPIADKTDEWRRDAIEKGQDVKNFFENPVGGEPPPGEGPLSLAFLSPPTPKGEKQIVPMKMGDVACQAFLKALGITPPLGIPETVVSGIVGVVLEFTEATYKALLVRDPKTPIDGGAVLTAARENLNLAKRLEDIAMEKLSFISDAKKWETPDVAGFKVRPGDLADKGVDKIDALIEEKVTPLLAPIIEYAMKSLADQLELGRQNGLTNTAHTMEWYLGRLPWVQATLFCNLFFPFWNALMGAVANLLGGPVGAALKGISDAASKVKGFVDTGRDKLAQGAAYKNAVEETVKSYSSINQSTDFKQKNRDREALFDQADRTKADKIEGVGGPKLDQGKFVIPVTGRSEKGQGKELKKAEYDEVKPNHKWDSAKDPAATEEKKDDATAKPAAA